ncbi:MAG: LysE family translocator [Phyllobacteriaceae bacterium]|nr:LysE family translocator [Phyllobacteriaceae bacterium]
MTATELLPAVLAGVVYVVTPGPATLAVLSITATRGRARGLAFFLGHGVGDATWSALALAALMGASRLGPDLFRLLGLVCGLYLIFLGGRAILAGASTARTTVGADRPIRTGIAFGLTNPKAYPFALAMYGALSVGAGPSLGLAQAVGLFLATSLGIAIGDFVTVAWSGLPMIGRLFLRFRGGVTRAVGLLFVLFGVRTVWEAVSPHR